jgi:predicted phosphodiesterase
MKAIISDDHANLEALQAVLDDIARQTVDDIYCLGDVIGYGPNPRECLNLVQKCKLVLLGNHDYAALAGRQGRLGVKGQRRAGQVQLLADVGGRSVTSASADFASETVGGSRKTTVPCSRRWKRN